MADVRSQQPQNLQVHRTTKQRYEGGGVMSLIPEIPLTASQLLALLAGVPLASTLLLLAGVSLIASLVGLALATPLFILFSPVLVPAAAAISMAVAAVLTAGGCGLVGLVSFSWVVNYVRKMPPGMTTVVPEQLDAAKRRVADMADYVGQKTKEVGQDIQSRAQAQGTTRMAVH